MTREQAKEFMWVENHKNPSVIKWQHHKTIRELVENLIDQIYNDHETTKAVEKQLEALQHRSCEGCKYLYINKHSEFVEYCTALNIEIPYSDITTFCCNRYEPKPSSQ